METQQRLSHFPLKPNRSEISWSPPPAKKTTERQNKPYGEFFGFGAAPPPRQKHPRSVQKTKEETKVLNEAENLVRVILGNDEEKLTSDSIQRVLEKHTATQTKGRYKTLLAKPWRTTPKKWEPNGRHNEEASESNIYERIENFEVKNPQSFRIRRSSDNDLSRASFFTRAKSMYNENFGLDDGNGRELKAELAEAAIELKAQKTRITFLKEQISVLQTSSSNDFNTSFLSDGGDSDILDRMERLQYRLQEAETSRDLAQSKSDEYRMKLEDMETRQKASSSDAEGLRNKIKELEDMMSLSHNKFQRDLDAIEMEKVVAEANVLILEKHLADAQKNIEDNESELKIRNELTTEQFVKFEAMLDEATAETNQVREQLAEAEREKESLEQRLEEVERMCKIQETNSMTPDKEQQNHIDEPTKSLAIAEAQLIGSNDDSREEIQGLQNRVTELEKQLVATEDRASHAEHDRMEATKEKFELKKTITALQEQAQNESNSFRASPDETQLLKNKIVRLEEMLADHETQSRNTNELNDIQSVHATQELGNVNAMLQCKEAELESCQRDLSARTKELQVAERKLIELQQQNNTENSNLEDELLKSETKALDLQREVDELAALNEELVGIKLELHNTKEELQKAYKQIDLLEASREETANRTFQCEAQIVELNQSLATANARCRDASSHLEDFEAAKSQELEILKDELRESENTIAYLMEDLDLLKPLTVDLEEAEKDLADTAAALESCKKDMDELEEHHEHEISELKESLKNAEQHSSQLNDELKLLLPLASELEKVKNELEEAKARHGTTVGDASSDLRVSNHKLGQDASVLRSQLEAKEDALRLAEQRASALVVAHNAEKERLAARYMESENENAHLCDELDAARKKLSMVEGQLVETQKRASALVTEMAPLKQKVESIDAAQMHLEAVDNLEEILEQKEKEIEALQKQVDVQEHQITSCRALVQDLEEERNYSRARITELSSMMRDEGEPQKLLQEKSSQCAKLTAERDTLQQKLKVVEAMAITLERDNEQKKILVQELMNTSAEDNATTIIEKLQSEHERTLQRCSDLSLQLAESQFRIDELTEKIRKAKKPKGPPPVKKNNQRSFTRSASFNSPQRQTSRASIKAMFAHGVDRLLSGDEGGEEKSEISRSVHGIMTNSPLKAFRRQGSMDNASER